MTAIETLVSWFKTPDGQSVIGQARAHQEQERLSARRRDAAALAEAQREELVAGRAHESRRSTAKADVDRRRRELDEATEALRQLDATHQEDIWELQRRAERLRISLRESQSLQIAQFVRDLRDDINATYAQREAVTERAISGTTRCLWSNDESIARRVEALRQAILLCGDNGPLVFEPLDDAALAERLNSIRTSLPAIEPRPATFTR